MARQKGMRFAGYERSVAESEAGEVGREDARTNADSLFEA